MSEHGNKHITYARPSASPERFDPPGYFDQEILAERRRIEREAAERQAAMVAYERHMLLANAERDRLRAERATLAQAERERIAAIPDYKPGRALAPKPRPRADFKPGKTY